MNANESLRTNEEAIKIDRGASTRRTMLNVRASPFTNIVVEHVSKSAIYCSRRYKFYPRMSKVYNFCQLNREQRPDGILKQLNYWINQLLSESSYFCRPHGENEIHITAIGQQSEGETTMSLCNFKSQKIQLINCPRIKNWPSYYILRWKMRIRSFRKSNTHWWWLINYLLLKWRTFFGDVWA